MTAIQEQMTTKHAETRYPIHDLLCRRWSPRVFADWPIAPETLHRMFQAARWAPSAGNGSAVGLHHRDAR